MLSLVEDLKTVPGIRAIVFGGSRARGSGDASSDTDVGIYYDPRSPLEVAALNQVAATHDDRKESGLVTSIGAWGPWINGGGWLRVDGAAVDLLYRDASKVESVVETCIAGSIEVAYQPGHPFGFLSAIYAGEISICQPLWDPTGWVASNKNRLIDYPEALRKALVRRFGFEARFCERVESIWGSVVKDSEALAAALAMVRELNGELKALVEKEGLRFGE